MIQFNPSVPSVNAIPGSTQAPQPKTTSVESPTRGQSKFAEQVKDVGDLVAKVDDMQQSSDASIQDLLSGKNNDVTAVVSNVAKADMSFKLLVGVRNKLIEAYKTTMNMQI
ncbi:flagellar hook-basal body complex protein FliE [Planctomycetota bacterium]